jgi:hypothetical protein
MQLAEKFPMLLNPGQSRPVYSHYSWPSWISFVLQRCQHLAMPLRRGAALRGPCRSAGGNAASGRLSRFAVATMGIFLLSALSLVIPLGRAQTLALFDNPAFPNYTETGTERVLRWHTFIASAVHTNYRECKSSAPWSPTPPPSRQSQAVTLARIGIPYLLFCSPSPGACTLTPLLIILSSPYSRSTYCYELHSG